MRFTHFTEPVFRPPQENLSLLVQVIQGCTHNQCHFCDISRKSILKVASYWQIEQALTLQAHLYPENTHVYLVGANPFALSFDRLKKIVLLVREHFPQCPEISMHTRISDVAHKTAAQLRELGELGITHLYPGTENGNDAALILMNKGATVADAERQLLRLAEAGIDYTVNYIIGMAGKGQGHVSAVKTAELFNKVKPRCVTTTGLTVFSDTPLYDMVQKGYFREASEVEKIEEQLTFVRHLTASMVVDFRHYLNFVNFTAKMPEHKEAAVKRLTDILRSHSNELIGTFYKRETFTQL